MGYFPGLTPFFGHFEPFPLCYYKYPYFWTVVNETWWDRPCHKKMTHNDSGPGPGQNYREKAVFTFVFTFVFLAKTLFFHFRKKNGRRAKKSSPTPQWGHRLPVTALVFCACWMTASFHCIVVLWTLPTGNWWGSSNRTLSIDKSTSWRTSRSIALHWWLNQWWCIKKLSSAVAQCQWW